MCSNQLHPPSAIHLHGVHVKLQDMRDRLGEGARDDGVARRRGNESSDIVATERASKVSQVVKRSAALFLCVGVVHAHGFHV